MGTRTTTGTTTDPTDTTTGTNAPGFTPAERAAMKERARELRAAARRGAARADAESAVLAKIAELPEPDRGLAERVHRLVREAAPELAPRLWYGMPAYARDDQVVVFFQAAAKFASRYATLGFSDPAHLDDGAMWPTSFALTGLGVAEEARIRELLRRAVSS